MGSKLVRAGESGDNEMGTWLVKTPISGAKRDSDIGNSWPLRTDDDEDEFDDEEDFDDEDDEFDDDEDEEEEDDEDEDDDYEDEDLDDEDVEE